MTVLIAHPDMREAELWRARLEKDGYEVVGMEASLAGMVQALCHLQVRLVVCPVGLLTGDALGILQQMRHFFPRTRMVIIGPLPLITHALPRLQNVCIKNAFDTDLQAAVVPHFPAPRAEDALKLLLRENLLSDAQAEEALRAAHVTLQPGLAVVALHLERPSGNMQPPLPSNDPLAPRYSFMMDATEAAFILDGRKEMADVLEAAEALRRHLKRDSDVGFAMGVSRVRQKAADLRICHEEARRAASASHIYGLNSVIHIEYLDKSDIGYAYPRHKERRLVECTLDGDAETALSLLDDIFRFLAEREKTMGERYINRTALRIWADLSVAAASRMAAYEIAQMDSMAFGKLILLKSREEAHAFLRQGVESLAREMADMMDVARDVLYLRLLALREEGKQPTPDQLTVEFHTTLAFLNDAIARNAPKESVFNFFSTEEE